MDDRLLEALSYIDPDVEYPDWVKVGMALKHEGYQCETWDNWSAKGDKYQAGECGNKWDSFDEDTDTIVTGGTLFTIAQRYGYETKRYTSDAFGWDDEVEEVGRNYKFIDSTFVTEEKVPKIPKNYDPVKDLTAYLDELFNDDDYVGYCDRLTEIKKPDGKIKYEPRNGIYRRTAGELKEKLKKGGFESASIQPEYAGGAMIRINPLDGSGESDSNIKEYRYCLIESDKDSLGKQYALYKEMKLPIKALVHSGNKSIHAIVHVDAESKEQYTKRVLFLHEFCNKNGLTIDGANKNASRYSRMPGIKRDGQYQYVIDYNVGFPNYKQWKEWADGQNDNLPKDVSLAEIWNNMPPLKPELIEGILRVGHKLLLSGPSKAGKSFALMELAIAIAEGDKWLDHQCKQGKVLYVNLELDEASCFHRFKDIYEKLNVRPDHTSNITIWNLRGRSVPMDKLTPFLISRFKKKGYIAIIIDPIYKVITGDENSATEMSEFCSYFDRAAIEIDCAMIYCHHHSKGADGKYANAVDRSSGSGVFARDPDAILDLTELRADGLVDKYKEQNENAVDTITAWELSGTLREFPPIQINRIWFDYPVHKADVWNYLADAKYNGSGTRGIGKDQTSKEDRTKQLDEAFEDIAFGADAVDMQKLLDALEWSDQTLKKLIGPKSHFEPATLSTGEKLVIRRNLNSFMYMAHEYFRPQHKNQKWMTKQDDALERASKNE